MPISQTEGYFGNPNYHLLEGRTYAFSVGKNSNFAVKFAKRSNVSYFIYLMNHLVQTLYSLRRTLMAETIFATESLLKMMKSTFYFTTKTLFVLKILSFCLDFLVMQQNCLIRKIRLMSNFMTSQLKNNCNTHIVQYLEK